MARCCSGATCSCAVMAGAGAEVTGIGSSTDPYVISLSPEANDLAGEQSWSEVMFAGTTVAGVNAVAVALEGLAAQVPPSDTPQIIRFAAPYTISVTGGGAFTLQLYETTSGTAVLQSYSKERIESTQPVSPGVVDQRVNGFYRIAPHTDYKMYQVFFTMTRDGGSTLQVGVPNVNAEYAKLIVEVEKL